ncbi:MAG TPA: hypothetical protein VN682_04220 [Terriglobales bacterium]|nr:hypothetical protein [Terriglobales bacterium]
MIEIGHLTKADNDEPPHFELQYVDIEKRQREKGYFQTTKYGSEAELREVLKSQGMQEHQIDEWFAKARRFDRR